MDKTKSDGSARIADSPELREAAKALAALGNFPQARERAAAALALAPHGTAVQIVAAHALAICGQAGQALALADDFNKRFPNSTLGNTVLVAPHPRKR